MRNARWYTSGTPSVLVALLRAGVRLWHDLRVAAGMILITGAAVSALGIWAFTSLADEVGDGETTAFDEAVLRRIDGVNAPWLEPVMLEITALGNAAVVFVLAAVAGAFLWLTRHRYSAALLVASTAGGALINTLLKLQFDRPRPTVVTWDLHLTTSSFPSGHATSAAVVYATIAYLAARLQRRRWARIVTLLSAATVIVLIAVSRLILGVHHPSDVAAGIVLGIAWAAFCMAVLEAVQRFILQGKAAGPSHELPEPQPQDETAAEVAAK